MPAIDQWDFVNPPTFEPMARRRGNSILATKDGARVTKADPARKQAVAAAHKFCLACPHWDLLHPGHGDCIGIVRKFSVQHPCPCPGFADPEPGRPDRVFTREQVDRMPSARWEAMKANLYLLKDGRYGYWDEWSDESWKAKPGQRFEAP